MIITKEERARLRKERTHITKEGNIEEIKKVLQSHEPQKSEKGFLIEWSDFNGDHVIEESMIVDELGEFLEWPFIEYVMASTIKIQKLPLKG